MVSWSQFQEWPHRPEGGLRYELHDGEVVAIPIPPPWQLKLSDRIERLLRAFAADHGSVRANWPYRPSPNFQYWVAGSAFVRQAEWEAMPDEEWQVYAPPLIVEVLSPSNTPLKVNRQRVTAMSGGTQEFWIVSRDKQTVEVSRLDGVQVYGRGDVIPVLFGGSIEVDEIFA